MDSSKEIVLTRYSRQIILPEIHSGGQKRLMNTHVGVIGCGGLGTAVIPYLVAAGVGHLSLYDDDKVDLTNLNRQVLYTPEDLESYKVDKATAWIKAFSPHTQVTAHPYKILPHNILEELKDYDLVIDCVDTVHTKYLINDGCIKLGKPYIHSSCVGFSGQVLVVPSASAPCLRCIFASIPPTCDLPNCMTAGILGATCGVVGSMAALEAIKMIVNPSLAASGRFLSFNFLEATTQVFTFEKDPHCPSCCHNPIIDPTCEADYLN